LIDTGEVGDGTELAHWPLASQVRPEAQVPQFPPQPSLPQALPLHAGVQVPLPA
jgi:hypothetical protein